VLLKEELSLRPVLVPKPSAADTWGLDRLSDARLTEWMHANLILAIQATDDPEAVETELVCLHAPPLNLTKCVQTEQHRTISRARSQIMASLQSGGAPPSPAGNLRPATQRVRRPKLNDELFQADSRDTAVQGRLETAEAIAWRYGLDPKSYRRRLRASVLWYQKPQDWTFAVGSAEWRDMIAVAEAMVRRCSGPASSPESKEGARGPYRGGCSPDAPRGHGRDSRTPAAARRCSP
jgi:hypothetical protein